MSGVWPGKGYIVRALKEQRDLGKQDTDTDPTMNVRGLAGKGLHCAGPQKNNAILASRIRYRSNPWNVRGLAGKGVHCAGPQKNNAILASRIPIPIQTHECQGVWPGKGYIVRALKRTTRSGKQIPIPIQPMPFVTSLIVEGWGL